MSNQNIHFQRKKVNKYLPNSYVATASGIQEMELDAD